MRAGAPRQVARDPPRGGERLDEVALRLERRVVRAEVREGDAVLDAIGVLVQSERRRVGRLAA